MSKKLVLLEEEEIEALKTLCQACGKMAKDSPFFEKINTEAQSVLEKLEALGGK